MAWWPRKGRTPSCCGRTACTPISIEFRSNRRCRSRRRQRKREVNLTALRELIVLPDDTAKPIVAAIDGARRSLKIKMFLFSDPTLLDAVTRAQRRGVAVQVMLNP